MKRLIIGGVLLCAIALGQSIVGTYVRSFPGDSGSMMEVYRDSSDSSVLQTRLTAISPARSAIGQRVGDPELAWFQIDHAATSGIRGSTGDMRTVVYKAMTSSLLDVEWPVTVGNSSMIVRNVVTVCYNPDTGIVVAAGDGPPFDPSDIVEVWTPLPTVPTRTRD